MRSWQIRASLDGFYQCCLQLSGGFKTAFGLVFLLGVLLTFGLLMAKEKETQHQLKQQLALLPKASEMSQAEEALKAFKDQHVAWVRQQAHKEKWLQVMHEIFSSHTSGCLLKRLSIDSERAVLLGFAQTQAKLTELTLSLARQSTLSMPRLLQLQSSQQDSGYDFSIQLDLGFDDHS